MKNLFLYVNPEKKFDRNSELMAQIQIDNGREFWADEDMMLVTNFPYEYHGFHATVIDHEDIWCKLNPKASKNNVIIYLLEHNMLPELTWYHDLDAYQLAPLDLPPLDRDIAYIDYGYKPKINTGNIFFKPTALDVFHLIRDSMDKYRRLDEETLEILFRENANNIHSRYRKFNVTYNIGMRKIPYLVSFAEPPLRVAHFPAFEPAVLNEFRPLLPLKLLSMLDEKFTPPY